MPLRVLPGVEQKTADGRREAGAADLSRLRERGRIRGSQLVDRRMNRGGDPID
jgi:hypothetical protein